MTISIEVARGVHGLTAQISHGCIYQAIYAHGDRGLRRGLHDGLHRRRCCRKQRLGPGQAPSKPNPLGEFNLIGLRPAIANGRTEVGHLEGDLIVGSFNRSAIAAVFDRASRHLWLADFPGSHDADETLAAVGEVLDRIPETLRRTLTWDQGREMARHHDLAGGWGIDVYFAEPHSPWQRPTNENGNGLIRRYVGKSTDLRAYRDVDLRAIEHRINTMPRRSLYWSTAAQVYDAAVAMTGCTRRPSPAGVDLGVAVASGPCGSTVGSIGRRIGGRHGGPRPSGNAIGTQSRQGAAVRHSPTH